MDRFPDNQFLDVSRDPMVKWLRRELDEIICQFRDYYNDGSNVTFIMVHLSFVMYHQNDTNFMMFCTILHLYITLFEDESPYTLYYVRFFRVSHLVTIYDGAIFHGIYYFHFQP